MSKEQLQELTLKVAKAIKANNPEMTDRECGAMAKEVILATYSVAHEALRNTAEILEAQNA